MTGIITWSIFNRWYVNRTLSIYFPKTFVDNKFSKFLEKYPWFLCHKKNNFKKYQKIKNFIKYFLPQIEKFLLKIRPWRKPCKTAKNKLRTEARWHIGMSSASHQEDPDSNPGKGQFFRIKMKDVTLELLRCSYSHIWWIRLTIVYVRENRPTKMPDKYMPLFND